MESDHEISRKMSQDQWMIDVKKDLEDGRLDGYEGGSHVRMPPIFRVQAKVREMNVKAYQPEVVSIGPYHHGEERLQAMEKHKRRALLHFLHRSNQTLEVCLDLLRDSLRDTMAKYHRLDRKWKDDEEEFLKLMLKDGCFILEILLTSVGVVEDYDRNDLIFGLHGRFYNAPSIRRDLLLIENQIPLLVLQKLFSSANIEGYGDINDLFRLLLEFLLERRGLDRIFGGDMERSLHILDLYRRRLFFVDEDGALFPREGRSDYNIMKTFSAPKIPSAMALQDHGILMRPHLGPTIRFSRRDLLWMLLTANFGGWELKMPGLTVDNATESTFLNAMVFESLHPAADARFTSYVYLMSNLTVSPKDASLLSTQLGIIRNELGSDQALVDLFRRLSSANFLHDYRLFLLLMMINEYCGRRWNRFRAYVNRTYFRNPWAQLSVFSAVVLFVLTAFQTFYAIYPNYTNKHNPK